MYTDHSIQRRRCCACVRRRDNFPITGPSRMRPIFTIAAAFAAVAFPHPANGQGIADVLERARPAVVTIVVRDVNGREIGQGSGFIVREDGAIITAWHVVARAATASVRLQSGASYAVAGMLAKDAYKDYAVIKVDAKSLPTLPLGDSDLVRQGDRILTLGSPLGLEETASEGMVSAVRLVGNARHLQITAPISNGSSGGPVLNLRGEALGIAVFVFKEGQGLNFAVEINEAKRDAMSCVKVAPLPAYVSPEEHEIMTSSAAQLDKMASAASDGGEYSRAARLWLAATLKDPSMEEAYVDAASMYDIVRDFAHMASILEKATMRFPRNARAFVKLGDAYTQLHSHDGQAATAYRTAFRLTQSLGFDRTVKFDAIVGLTISLEGLGRYAEALAALRSASEPTLYGEAGLCAEALGRHADAEAFFAKFVRGSTNPVDGWTKIGDTWAGSARSGFHFGDLAPRRAAAAYRRAIDLAKGTSYDTELCYFGLAEAHEGLGEWNAAIVAWKHLTDTRSVFMNIESRAGIAMDYLKIGDLAAAEQRYDELSRMQGTMHEVPAGLNAWTVHDAVVSYKVLNLLMGVSRSIGLALPLSKRPDISGGSAAATVDGRPISLKSAITTRYVDWLGGEQVATASLDVAALPDGRHQFEVIVKDKCGKRVAATTLTLLVDNSETNPNAVASGVQVELPWTKLPESRQGINANRKKRASSL